LSHPTLGSFVRGRRRVLLSVLRGRRLAPAPGALVAVHPRRRSACGHRVAAGSMLAGGRGRAM